MDTRHPSAKRAHAHQNQTIAWLHRTATKFGTLAVTARVTEGESYSKWEQERVGLHNTMVAANASRRKIQPYRIDAVQLLKHATRQPQQAVRPLSFH